MILGSVVSYTGGRYRVISHLFNDWYLCLCYDSAAKRSCGNRDYCALAFDKGSELAKFYFPYSPSFDQLPYKCIQKKSYYILKKQDKVKEKSLMEWINSYNK